MSVIRSKMDELQPAFQPKSSIFVPKRKEISRCKEKVRKELQIASFFNNYYGMNKTVRGYVGHQMSDFIDAANFDAEKLTVNESFTQIVKPNYGACYTFNGQTTKSNKTAYISRTIGSSSGLTIQLNLQLEEYTKLTSSVGAVVVIHPSEEFPDTDGAAISIMPGVETSIAITKESFKRLPAPYKDKCRDYNALSMKKIKPIILNQQDCYLYCLQRVNNKECGCTDPTMIYTKNTTKCDLQDKNQVCCLEKVFAEFSKDTYKRCDCPLECKTEKYPVVISSALWPAYPFFIWEILPEISTSYGNNSILPEDEYLAYRSGYSKVNIYYSNLEEMTFVQTPTYQDSEWYSHLGGQLGLWLGVSLPAMFDGVETIVILVYHSVTKYHSKTKLSSSK